MTRAVAGATTMRSARLAEPRVRDGLGAVPQRRPGRLGRQRRERQRADEAGGARGQHRGDVGAGVDQPAADLDGLVGGDAPGDAEDDPAPGRSRPAGPVAARPSAAPSTGRHRRRLGRS